MRLDKFSNPVFNSTDVFNAMYQGKTDKISSMIVDQSEEIEKLAEVSGIECIQYDQALECLSLEEFDQALQSQWFMPDEYRNLDIEQLVLSRTSSELQKSRVLEELDQFKQRKMFDVLRWLVYFVDKCRQEQILWGVGRGSSVASYVLFLIGVHKIDSIKYNLDWQEFLKPQ